MAITRLQSEGSVELGAMSLTAMAYFYFHYGTEISAAQPWSNDQ